MTTPASSRPSDRRMMELDVVRGVAIILVLWLHTYFRTWPEMTVGELRFLWLSHLYAHGAVPLFLFLTGFLLHRDRSPDAITYLRRRGERVLVPGLIWMTLALGWYAWRAGGLSHELWRAYAFFDISGQFYYLIVWATFTIAGYPMRRLSTRALAVIAGAAFIGSLGMVAWYEQREITGDFAIIAYRNPLVWAHFYCFGVLAGRVRPDLRWGARIELGALGAMITIAWLYLRRGEANGIPTSYFGVLVFLHSALGVIVYPALARRIRVFALGRLVTAPFAALAPYAFAIYLSHKPYFLGWLSDRLVSDTVLSNSYTRLSLGLFAVGGTSAIAFVVLVTWAAPAFGARVLGVERATMRPPASGRGETEPSR